jgi:hypothetical protein
MRYLCLTAVLVLVGLVSTPARAQVFEFYPYDEDNDESLTDLDFSEWANMARCLCDEYAETQDASTATLHIRVRYSGGSLTTDEVYFYLGDDCDSESTSISDVCRELTVINHSDFNEEQTIEVPIHWVVDPMGGQCSEVNGGTTTLYVIMGDPNNAPSDTKVISYDTAPPGVPTSVTAQGGEGAVSVSWNPPDSDDENIEYYNVLCAVNGSDATALTSPSATASWTSTQDICELNLSADATALDVETDCTLVTGGFSAGESFPNPCFVCGTVGSSAFDLRISGLKNEVVYDFAVVAIDENGNVSSVSEVASASPVPTIDFAERYSAYGGAEDGGFCFIATAVYGDYDHPNVQRLRTYRDQVLARSPAGQRFIAWYYANGPKMVRLERRFPQVGVVSRLGLEGLVWISRQLTPGQGGADPQRAALPLGVLLIGVMLGLSRLVGRREEEPATDDTNPEVTP